MAYPRGPAQRPPPVRNYGGGGPPPRGGGFQGPPQDGYFDQDAYDYGYDNPNPKQRYGNGGYDDAGYGYPGEQAIPRSYGPPRGAPRPPRGGYGPPMDQPPDRSYAYGGRSAPMGNDARRGHGDRGPPRSDRMRPPPRQVPQSPDKMGWDNPFPMFPPKEPSRGRADSQGHLERGMAGMDLNGSMPPVKPPVRPHTSNGRRPEPSSRPPMPMPPPPGRGRGNPPAMPMRSASAGRHVAGPPLERSYTDASEPPPPIPQINRSATMPVTSAPTPPPVSKPLYPGQTTYQEPNYAAFRYTREYSTEELLDVYYNSAHAAEPDMPNFDAIPEHGDGSGIDESLPGLEQPKPKKTPVESPPPSRGQYTAFNPQAAQLHHAQSQPDMRSGNAPNQFENAGFQFDLPGEPPASPGYSPAYSAGYRHDSMGFGIGDNPYYDPAPAQYGGRQDSRSQSITSYSERRPSFASREGSIRGNGPPKPYRANQAGYAPNPPPAVNEIEPTVDPDQNPDALPHHPVPFRPGHDSGSKPAPMRQYNASMPVSGPVPTPPPAPASAPPALQQPPMEMPVHQPVTREEIQRLQQTVKSRPSDQKTQILLAKKLVEASTVLVEQMRTDPKTKAKAREKYVNDAYKIIKKLVAAGNGEAQFFLADAYGQGSMGLQVDNKEAFNLYHSAAKQGHAQSAYRVAVCCEIGAEEGGGTKRDPFKAVQWYKRAASLGDPPAMYKMGMILLKGLLGQAKNPREGISWLKRAAERADVENPHALHELALLYVNASSNDVVIRDEVYACQLFHQAAELGYKFSQNRLGTAYEYGLMGCPVDPRQSIVWYTHAAAQGEHQSELALSGWYLTGCEGMLQQSDTEAYLWARKAASAGLAKAEYAMGYFTEVGIGTTANLDDAKRWYWRAAAQGFPKARERLEELKKGGARMQKTRLSRSAVNQQKQNDGDCTIM